MDDGAVERGVEAASLSSSPPAALPLSCCSSS